MDKKLDKELSREKLLRLVKDLQGQNKLLQEDLEHFQSVIKELKDEHDQKSDLIDLAADAILSADKTGQIIGANQSAIQLTGYPLKELLSLNIADLFSQEEHKKNPLRYDLLMQGKAIQTERQMTCKNGSTIHIEMHSKMMPNDTLHSFVRNISKRKEMEEALGDSIAQQKALADATFEAIFLSLKGMCIGQNSNAEKIFGYTLEEALGKPGTDWIVPEERDKVMEKILSGYDHSYETIALRKDGSSFPVEIQGRTIHHRGKQVRVTALRDISTQKQTEKDSLTIQKLTSIGTLAGGIAHDFNNILTGLFGNISLAKIHLDSDHKSFNFLDRATKSLNRATHLTGKLLTFAKGGEPIREKVSLSEIVTETVSFDLSGSNIKLIFNRADDLWSANVDKGQIQQVFSNLAINAKQAMPDGGHFHITLKNCDNSKGEITELEKGKFIKIVVKDEGVGINQKHLDRIFDPYFSTKQTGRGLGLASVFSIISRHNGLIKVSSIQGEETIFVLYLPASTLPVKDTSQKTTIGDTSEEIKARVLIMDDEEEVRHIVTEMLKTMNCEVICTEDGPLAVQTYRNAVESGQVFDLVILDLTVPGGGGGKEAVQEILKIDPKAKVVVSSGYTDDPVMSRYTDYGFKAVVKKPYELYQLRNIISDIAAR